uniref:TIGR03087 family PEP-CTERM/XrtA system glycosyltransferase n=1 Tax=Parerythrobacter lutipelagi TaxID=1964208 RepID=UPI0010F52F24|nr:TIGR03087 family PEP-CTERM/XrtA system glycosyltransferase [Parerythrobacter lutipelagi]
MSDILFLSHRIPFPPDRGDKIRSHHLLKALAHIAPVHAATFGETAADMAEESALEGVAKSHLLIQRDKALPIAGIEALLTGKPVSLTAFDDVRLREWVGRTLAEQPIRTIVVFSGQMGQYVPDDFDGRVVIDLCDVDSAKFDAYAEEGRLPRSLIDRREGRILAAEEARLADRSNEVLLVSEAEAELFRSRLPDGSARKVSALRNGIDAHFFDPEGATSPSPFAGGAGPHLVFTGQMDYPPNVSAVQRVAASLLPSIRQEFPDAQFHIVGRAPIDKVMRLNAVAGVKVWGEVPDVRPFIRAADAILAPLTIARGIQNKVLEAMAMARPVIVSPEAATGIDATDGIHFAVGDSDDALVKLTIATLSDGEAAKAMGVAARRYVLQNQSWEAMLAPLPALLGREPRHVA